MNRIAITLVSALLLAATPVLAEPTSGSVGKSNFSYGTLGIQLGRVTPDQDIVFFNEVYEEFGAAGINGSVQVADNLAIGGAVNVFANEGNRTEITNSTVGLSVFFPVPLGGRVDLLPQVGYANTEVEACLGNICAKEDDDAVTYGLFLRAWAVPGVLEVSGGYSDSNNEDFEGTTSIGGAVWFNQNHSVGLDYETSDSFDAVLLGYRFSW